MPKAKNLISWFALHDALFGLSIKNLDPEAQGRAICLRYDLDFEKMYKVYLEQGVLEGDAYLLRLLNGRTGNG